MREIHAEWDQFDARPIKEHPEQYTTNKL